MGFRSRDRGEHSGRVHAPVAQQACYSGQTKAHSHGSWGGIPDPRGWPGMRKLSIGMRLTLWYLAIFALAQLVFGAGMWLVLRHHLYDLVDDNLEREVDDLNNLLHAQKTNKTLAGLRHEL